jgi:AraC-like DNA-binding protein
MLTLETAIRLVVIGQELLIAAVFLFSAGERIARISGALLMLSIAGHLYASDPVLRDLVPLLTPAAILFAIIVPFFLWLFARAVFEAPWPKPVIMYVCVLLIVCVWGINVAQDILNPGWVRAADVVLQLLKLLIVAHTLWITLRGRPDDLIERRRTLRLFYVGIISVQIAVVLVVELFHGGSLPPGWLQLTDVIIIAILTLGLSMPMLRLNHEFFELQTNPESTTNEEDKSNLGVAEGILRDKLLALMDDGYFQEMGLTIPVLAGKLGHPEHQLRRLINGHLGYRNFSAFLNSYRIAAAKQHLADPERARTPVLTIALDLGYASLGPFNRAFKETTGTTPTDFRRQKLGRTIADSE